MPMVMNTTFLGYLIMACLTWEFPDNYKEPSRKAAAGVEI